MSLFLIVEAVASLGAATGTTYFIARLRALGQPHRIPEVLRTAIRPVAAVSVAAAVALALLAEPAAPAARRPAWVTPARSPPRWPPSSGALAVALPFAALLDTLLGATRGFRAMGPTDVVDRIGRPLLQLAGVAAAAAAGSAPLLAPLWALPYLPAAVVVWLWLRRIRRRQRRPPPRSPPGPPLVPPAAPATDRRSPLGFWRFTGRGGWPRWPRSPSSASTSSWSRCMRGPAAGRGLHRRDPVPGGRAVRQPGHRDGRPAPVHRDVHRAATGRGRNRVYQATTAWLILLTWPMYLLAVAFGPAGHRGVRPVLPRRGGGDRDPGADHAAGHRRAGRSTWSWSPPAGPAGAWPTGCSRWRSTSAWIWC